MGSLVPQRMKEIMEVTRCADMKLDCSCSFQPIDVLGLDGEQFLRCARRGRGYY